MPINQLGGIENRMKFGAANYYIMYKVLHQVKTEPQPSTLSCCHGEVDNTCLLVPNLVTCLL